MKEIIFENYKIKFIPTKYFFGYKKIKTTEGELFIVEDEKLLIDSLLKWREMGNFDEIKKIIRNAEISEEKIVEYMKRTNNVTLIKRVGYLLEKERGIDVSSYFKLDNNYVRLNLFSKHIKEISSKWRIKL